MVCLHKAGCLTPVSLCTMLYVCIIITILPANAYQCFTSIHVSLQYGSDKDNVNHLLRITTHFDLEVYTKSRKDKHLQSLLNILRDIVDKQSDQTVSVCVFIVNVTRLQGNPYKNVRQN